MNASVALARAALLRDEPTHPDCYGTFRDGDDCLDCDCEEGCHAAGRERWEELQADCDRDER